MEVGFNQHIGIFKNAYSKEYCDKIISQFELLDKHGFTQKRQEYQDSPTTKKDDQAVDNTALDLNNTSDVIDFKAFHNLITEQFFETFWECYDLYQDEYGFLRNFAPHYVYTNKIQRTTEGQGFHVWHTENMTPETSRRIGTFILYLNNIEEGGETELLYQKLRIEPEVGKLIVFPAGITHIHRGNPPLKGTKYIATGWLEY